MWVQESKSDVFLACLCFVPIHVFLTCAVVCQLRPCPLCGRAKKHGAKTALRVSMMTRIINVFARLASRAYFARQQIKVVILLAAYTQNSTQMLRCNHKFIHTPSLLSPLCIHLYNTFYRDNTISSHSIIKGSTLSLDSKKIAIYLKNFLRKQINVCPCISKVEYRK